MKIKGQIFSIDFLLSLIIVVFAIGLLVQLIELNAYDLKEKELNRELEGVALTAGSRLVNSEKISCELVTSAPAPLTPPQYVMNCIDRAKAGTVTKNDLGIPTDFDCNISIDGITGIPFNNCNTAVTGLEKNIAGIDRNVVLHSGSLTKSELEKCLGDLPGCTLTEGTAKVLVWR